MHPVSLVWLTVLLATTATSFGVRRQSGGCTCGSDHFTAEDITNALSQAKNGGGGDYPSQYDNDEDFSFPSCSGELFDYPLKHGSVYTDGSPGPDRVVFDDAGHFCGCIAHTGGSREGEVIKCS